MIRLIRIWMSRSGYYKCPNCGYWAFDGTECHDCGYRR